VHKALLVYAATVGSCRALSAAPPGAKGTQLEGPPDWVPGLPPGMPRSDVGPGKHPHFS
jgi:hypothetical protein